MTTEKKVALADVARAVGVSVRTASRTLRDEGNVATATAARIRAVAAQLGYRPNLAARSLRTGRAHEVTVIVWSFERFHASVELTVGKIEGLAARLAQKGYPISIRVHTDASRPTSVPPDVIEDLMQRRPMGVALFPLDEHLTAPCFHRLESAGIPSVILDAAWRIPDADNISVDRRQSVRDAVRYLALSGRRTRIAYLGPELSPFRLDGYRDAMTETGREPIFLFVPQAPTDDALYRAGKAVGLNMRRMDPRPDAIQAYSDPLAIGFIEGLKQAGLRCPQDIAVIGFDNRQSSVLSDPELTTIEQPNWEVGLRAADILLAKIAGEPRPNGGWSALIPGRLIIRGSA